MREREIEKYLSLEVKKQGGLCMKWVSPGCTGVPDRIAIFPGGRIVFLELKAPWGRLSSRQRYVHRSLKDLGCRVEIINSILEVDSFIAEVENASV